MAQQEDLQAAYRRTNLLREILSGDLCAYMQLKGILTVL